MAVLCEDVGQGIVQMTLCREPVNALNPEFLADVEHKLTAIDGTRNARALVITSGLSVFSAGMDLKQAQEFSPAQQAAVVNGLNQTFFKLYSMSKPVIAAANGTAIAGGLFFILASDYALTREGTQFALAEVRVGVNFPIVPLEIARATLAPHAFRRLLLSGHHVDAVSARNLGVVDEVTGPEQLLPRAHAVARDYASIPPIAYANVKAQMRELPVQTMRQSLRQQTDPALAGWFTAETRSAMARALAARKGGG